jgi:hypothetical protein
MEMTQQDIQKLVHDEVLKVFGSRRGLEGPPGKPSTVAGPQGEPGKNSSVVIGQVTAGEQAAASITPQADGVHVLNLTLPRGLKGDTGAASTIPGPVGAAGQSIRGEKGERGADAAPARDGVDGRPGRDAIVRIGSVVQGDIAAASMRTINGVTYLDLVLPKGDTGAIGANGESVAGPAGKDGTSWDSTSQSELAYLEARFRNIWKSDIRVAIGAHFKESHLKEGGA